MVLFFAMFNSLLKSFNLIKYDRCFFYTKIGKKRKIKGFLKELKVIENLVILLRQLFKGIIFVFSVFIIS